MYTILTGYAYIAIVSRVFCIGAGDVNVDLKTLSIT